LSTMLEVEPEVASKIQARARERGVSVDVYLQELIDQKETDSERSKWLSSQERIRMLREWASVHRTNTPLLSDDSISPESIYGGRGQRSFFWEKKLERQCTFFTAPGHPTPPI